MGKVFDDGKQVLEYFDAMAAGALQSKREGFAGASVRLPMRISASIVERLRLEINKMPHAASRMRVHKEEHPAVFMDGHR